MRLRTTLGLSLAAQASTLAAAPAKLLVLGGNGFVGEQVCSIAVARGCAVVSLSRRGAPSAVAGVTSVAGDAAEPGTVAALLADGGFTGVVHAIGALLDVDSGLANLNVYASGSGSVPAATYDTITRLTAFNAMDAWAAAAAEAAAAAAAGSGASCAPVPFTFVSAAEAGWPEVRFGEFIEANLAPEWLQRYLAAKRAVEQKLTADPNLRHNIMRPSLVWTPSRVGSLPPVAAFAVGARLGLPFVDNPVRVETLAAAIVEATLNGSVSGTHRYPDMVRIAEGV